MMNAKEYSQILYEALADKSDRDQDKIIDRFTSYLIRTKKTHLRASILREFSNIEDETERGQVTYISSASKLSSEQKIEFEKIYGENMEFIVNKKLLAGVAIRRKDILYDYTLHKRLERLKSSL